MIDSSRIGRFGFGLMRLPKKDGGIDIEQTKEMVDLFMDAGFNYFDTAWAYGGSEDAIRQALVERYPRESFYLATKNAAWISCKTREEAAAQFETSLERLGTEYVDFYLLHNLGNKRTKVFEDFDLWDYFGEKKKEGKIKHLGFSFHSTAAELEEILDAHPEAEFVQLQINYADWESESVHSRRCYEAARKRGIPVIVMEPVKGGLLATPPEKVREIFRSTEPGSSFASWAIRFCADLDGVLTVLSGASSTEQMKDTLSAMRGFSGLSDSQRRTLAEASEALLKYPVIPCTSCDYCFKVCPEDIGISGTFEAMNMVSLYGNRDFALTQMGWSIDAAGRKRAKDCIKCGRCEKACPQHIEIRKELERCVKELG